MSAPEQLIAPPQVDMWQPESISPRLAEAYRHYTEQLEAHGPKAITHRAARLFAGRLVNEARDAAEPYYEHTSDADEAQQYRAERAVNRGAANCIAFHEIVLGYLKKLDVAGSSVGVWQGSRHAFCGVMFADVGYEIDASQSKFMPLPETNIPYLPYQSRETAWRECIETNRAVLIYASRDSGDVFSVICEPDEVGSLDPHPGYARQLIMPAEASVRALAFLGDCERYRQSGREDQLGKIALRTPFVPPF